eukprot:gene14447-7128_t
MPGEDSGAKKMDAGLDASLSWDIRAPKSTPRSSQDNFDVDDAREIADIYKAFDRGT